jgi:4-hydroxybenzoate polyprenyltransferase
VVCDRCTLIPACAIRHSPLAILKVSRPGFWLTSIWFYLLPVGGREVWAEWTFWLGVGYVTLPLGLLIYGWNDLVDAENDRANPRKDTFLFGARPTAAQLAVLPRWIALAQAPFILLFAILFGAKSFAWWAAVLTFAAIYNWPRIGLKNHPGVDLINQAGYVLVFVLSSWLNAAPQLPLHTFLFGALFAMHSHLFGQIMDREPDLAAGRRTTVGLIGRVPAKCLAAALLGCEAALVWRGANDPLLALALGLGAVFFLLDGLVLWRSAPYANWQMRAFFLAWNVAALVSIPWVWSRATLAG